MNNPRDILNRARQRQRRADAPQTAPRTPAPAPMQPPAASSPAPRPEPSARQENQPPERRVAPRPMGGHTLYRELMRSHDRMGTRHIKDRS